MGGGLTNLVPLIHGEASKLIEVKVLSLNLVNLCQPHTLLLLICSHELPKGLEDMSVVHSPIVQVNNVRCKRKRLFQKIEDVEELAKKVNDVP